MELACDKLKKQMCRIGAQLLGWEIDKLLEMTLKAMQDEETAIETAVAEGHA